MGPAHLDALLGLQPDHLPGPDPSGPLDRGCLWTLLPDQPLLDGSALHLNSRPHQATPGTVVTYRGSHKFNLRQGNTITARSKARLFKQHVNGTNQRQERTKF